MVARQIAGRFLREGFRHGLLASDLLTALQELAPSAGRREERDLPEPDAGKSPVRS
jgi:hypothetical protein